MKYIYKLKQNFPRPLETFLVRYYGWSTNKTNHTL